jgi:hypothetical protein
MQMLVGSLRFRYDGNKSQCAVQTALRGRGCGTLMRWIAWAILSAVFLAAGEGLNLFRSHLEAWLAYGHMADVAWMAAGLLIAFVCTAFLGGFIYYRDRKHGKIRREGWRRQPVRRTRSHDSTSAQRERPL